MQYQTFRGADLEEALGRVKAAFGAEAVIQSTRHITSGKLGLGGGLVEVTAGAPTIEPARWPFSPDVPRNEGRASNTRPDPRGTRGVRPRTLRQLAQLESTREPAAQAIGLQVPADVDRELRSLRAMLEELSSTRKPKERAVAMLQDAGFEGAMARELATGCHRAGRQGVAALREWISGKIRARLKLSPGIITRPQRQVVACVGPSGAGKTTTLAKLAARARLEHSRSVGIVSLDTYRVGAVEQWQRYAQLLGIPFAVARGVSDFQQAVSASTCDLILVDTSGRAMVDHADSWPLLQCLPHVTKHELQVLIVLPAWLRARDAEQVVRMYSDTNPTGTVVTKTDETTQAGGALQAILANELPLAYVCNGPRVPEDIREASTEIILKGLFLADA